MCVSVVIGYGTGRLVRASGSRPTREVVACLAAHWEARWPQRRRVDDRPARPIVVKTLSPDTQRANGIYGNGFCIRGRDS